MERFMNQVMSKSSQYPQKSGAAASVINFLIGIWLIISTFAVTAFSKLQNLRWNNVIVGILIGLFSIVRASGDERACWSWSNVVLGIWLIISPFVLGFSVTGAVWHNIIFGIIVATLAWARALMPAHSHAA